MTNYLLFLTMPMVVWFVVVLFTKRPVSSSDADRKAYLILAGACLFLMVALRHYSVGSGDAGWYYNNWKLMANNVSFGDMKGILSSFDMENGYLICVWLLSRVFRHPQFLFVGYGLLMTVSFCRFLYKYCSDVVMGMVMFSCLGLWGFMLQGLRQGIAICICVFAVDFCLKRKLVPFLLLVGTACMFHASAIVFVIVYFFTLFHMDIKSYLIVLGSAGVAVFLIDWLVLVLNLAINDTYSVGAVEDTEGGIVSALIYLLIVVCSMLFYRERPGQDSSAFSFFFYMTLCGCVVFLMRYSVNTIAQRVAYYFMFAQIAALPTLADTMFARNSRTLAHGIILVLCLGVALYKSSYSTLIPYIFFWQA